MREGRRPKGDGRGEKGETAKRRNDNSEEKKQQEPAGSGDLAGSSFVVPP
jgi:hypothetical protein